MVNPEQGPEQQGLVGTWQTVSLGLPDFLEPVRQAINAFFSALIQILNILLAVLEILKTFAFGFLDPVIALIEALLKEIEALLRDLRNAGLYIHGDFYILEGPEFKNLLGGYNAFETRMITRLVDRRDPNRPDISSRSAVIAVFLYLSVDATSLHRLLKLIRGILALFNRKVPIPRGMGAVTQVNATYGLEGASIFSFKKSFFPDARFRNTPDITNAIRNTVNITWNMAPAPGNFITNFAQLPPRGFLVEVSTIAQPIQLVFDKIGKGAQQENQASASASLPPPKMESGGLTDTDGVPIQLTGGIDWLSLQPGMDFNDSIGFTGDLKANAARVYGIKSLVDAAPIQLGQGSDGLQQGSKYFLQKTFYVPTSQSLFFPGKGYGVTLTFDEMPFSAEWELASSGKTKRVNDDEQPARYFVRVRAVSKNITGLGANGGFQYQAQRVNFDGEQNPVPLPLSRPDISLGDIGAPTSPFEIVFPDANTADYLRCVATALAIMVLARADLPWKFGTDKVPDDGSSAPPQIIDYPPAPGQLEEGEVIGKFWAAFLDTARKPTQLETFAKFLLPQLIGRKRRVAKYYDNRNKEIGRWRKKLYYSCLNLTNLMYRENRPSRTLQDIVVNGCEDLREWGPSMFSDEYPEGTLLDLLLSPDADQGFALNRFSASVQDDLEVIRQTEFVGTGSFDPLNRGPHFFDDVGNIPDGGARIFGSADNAPVVFVGNRKKFEKIDFIRNAIPDEVYLQAAFALRIASGPVVRPQEKGWIAFRLFPQGLPDIDRFFDELLALLKSIRAALQAIADLIRQFIEFLQSRIIELQALLNRINAMIQNLLTLFGGLPAASGLVVLADGTDAVLASLVTAQNKPFDSPRAYGGGVVLLAGGIPTIALDVFKALVSGSGD